MKLSKVLPGVMGVLLIGSASCAPLSRPVTQREQTAAVGGLAGGATGAIIGSMAGGAVAGGLFGIPIGAVAGYFVPNWPVILGIHAPNGSTRCYPLGIVVESCSRLVDWSSVSTGRTAWNRPVSTKGNKNSDACAVKTNACDRKELKNRVAPAARVNVLERGSTPLSMFRNVRPAPGRASAAELSLLEDGEIIVGKKS